MTEPTPTAAPEPAPGAVASEAIHPSRSRGLVLALGATTCWSTAGILIRLVREATSWHIIVYRSIGVAAMVAGMIVLMHRGRTGEAIRRAGWPAVLVGVCSCASSVLFILALGRVTVANALFMGGITPFLAAIGGQVLLGERVSRSAWGAMALAATGVTVMLGSGLALGQLAGNLLALGSAVTFAAHGLVLRINRQTDMLPAVLWAGMMGAFVGLVALGLGGQSPRVPARDLLLGLTMGAVQLGGGLVLFTRASRHLVTAELQLIATSELVMAPLWVWIAIGETPNAATLAGGTLVLLAILVQAIQGWERSSR